MKLITLCLVAALGGLLFGFDTVVIAGAKPFYESAFGIAAGTWLSGFTMSATVLGCIVGAVGFMKFPDRFGRKPALVLSASFCVAGSLGATLSQSAAMLILCRMVGGMGVGLASNASPLYIAEVSPAERRGALVSVNQLMIVIGIMFAQFSNWAVYAICGEMPATWRIMFGVEVLPAVAFLLLALRVPESPIWLASRAAEKNAASRGKVVWSGQWGVLALGVFLAVYQQWSGINAVLYYASDIFRMAGFGMSGSLLSQIVIGAVNLGATVAAIFLVDRVGRRRLLLAGAAGLAILYGFLGAAYRLGLSGFGVLVAVVAVVACFALTLGPVVWVVLSELFPTRIRGVAMSVSIAALWTGCFSLTLSFPPISAAAGPSGSFWIYAAVSVVAFVVMRRFVPETGGKDLA